MNCVPRTSAFRKAPPQRPAKKKCRSPKPLKGRSELTPPCSLAITKASISVCSISKSGMLLPKQILPHEPCLRSSDKLSIYNLLKSMRVYYFQASSSQVTPLQRLPPLIVCAQCLHDSAPPHDRETEKLSPLYRREPREYHILRCGRHPKQALGRSRLSEDGKGLLCTKSWQDSFSPMVLSL